MHHVKTQAPYALFVGFISIITGDLLSGYLYPDYVGLLITTGLVLVGGFFLSARPDREGKTDLFSKLFGCCCGRPPPLDSEQSPHSSDKEGAKGKADLRHGARRVRLRGCIVVRSRTVRSQLRARVQTLTTWGTARARCTRRPTTRWRRRRRRGPRASLHPPPQRTSPTPAPCRRAASPPRGRPRPWCEGAWRPAAGAPGRRGGAGGARLARCQAAARPGAIASGVAQARASVACSVH